MSGNAHTMFTARVKHSDGEDVKGLRRVFPLHEDKDINFGNFLYQWSGRDFDGKDLHCVEIYQSLHFEPPSFECTTDQPMAATMLGLGFKSVDFTLL